ncbi:photosynthetic NDH subunit of lumenal location 3 chloroplastic isoform X2 [Tripterygium wilfordii]|uniref:Photosynthetic NDH subunit of lumenal location 3 chloroplastic isoform X2 n=1 Tax=Tripterygium wilfordii TaxID=458696 RepID=A0A7J7C2I7_TRIWF|nr:photosynthetic NDH subunit of lumenal location 3, chloroplastic [Tripterygium wilfordii]KAF5728364.1 photosynthetic NDH subunit of lumenal location 3 chloroplastic isoform X2 [Tripterygium wilfordii]
MAGLAHLNGVTDTLPSIPRIPNIQTTRKSPRIVGFLSKKAENFPEHQQLLTTRRVALGIASITLLGHSSNGVSLAEDNRFFITGPLPEPSVENKIANEKTGTRSFLRKRLYMANIGVKGSAYRLRRCAFDLLAMEDLIGKDTLNYVKKYLRFKSTFMYYDFDKVISAAPADEKQPLLNLANRLFDSFEKLEDAAKIKSLPRTESCYRDTKGILEEVMQRMA